MLPDRGAGGGGGEQVRAEKAEPEVCSALLGLEATQGSSVLDLGVHRRGASPGGLPVRWVLPAAVGRLSRDILAQVGGPQEACL